MDWLVFMIIVLIIICGLILILFGYMIGWYTGKKKGEYEGLKTFRDELKAGINGK
ncbi:MAG: hypothetical protein WC516_08535 [Patescibacteria group bacterium]|jgi:VIT1/CCC1 family predicted Fe2+/Mn2+ transporter